MQSTFAHVDNRSLIDLAKQEFVSRRSKHISLRYMSVREKVDTLCYVPTAVNLSDSLAKPMNPVSILYPLDVGEVAETEGKALWPTALPEQIAAVRAFLSNMGEATPEQIARQFKRGRAASVKPLLESLTALGQARLIEGGRFAA